LVKSFLYTLISASLFFLLGLLFGSSGMDSYVAMGWKYASAPLLAAVLGLGAGIIFSHNSRDFSRKDGIVSFLTWVIWLTVLKLSFIFIYVSHNPAAGIAAIWATAFVVEGIGTEIWIAAVFIATFSLVVNFCSHRSYKSILGLIVIFIYGGSKVVALIIEPPLGIEEQTKKTAQETSVFGNGFDGNVRMLALDPKGNLFVGGEFSQYYGLPVDRLVRLSPQGILDPSFKIAFPDPLFFASTLFVLPSGRILIVNHSGRLLPAKDEKPERLIYGQCLLTSSEGQIISEYESFDPHSNIKTQDTYGYLLTKTNNGSTTQLSLQKIDAKENNVKCFLPLSPSDQISVADDFSDRPKDVKGLNKSMVCVPLIDPAKDSRDLRGTGNIYVVYRYEDGRMLTASNYDGKITRYLADGSVDQEFSANIKDGFDAAISDFSVDEQGNIFVGGVFRNFNARSLGLKGQRVKGIAKLYSDGRLDESFGQGQTAKK
jgi:hypothetical protein